jgi:hypothetical protein
MTASGRGVMGIIALVLNIVIVAKVLARSSAIVKKDFRARR